LSADAAPIPAARPRTCAARARKGPQGKDTMTAYDLRHEAMPNRTTERGTFGGGRRTRRTERHDAFTPERTERKRADRAARMLGWFSLGLGIAELAAPRAVARAIGLDGRASVAERLLERSGLADRGRDALPEALRADDPTAAPF